MREKNRKPIASIKKLPQFTTMNVIDGQAGLISYFSLIFYSLTIDNILNIIVLLILAGVSISMLTGENGILTKSQDASERTEEGKEDELRKLTALEAATNIENTTHTDNSMGEEKTVTIPAGFAVSQVEGENTIANGLVIVDKNGNEFVWVPISKEDFNTQFVRREGYCKGNLQEISNYGEADNNGNNTNPRVIESEITKKEAQEMYQSVFNNEGFYIGRFETGKDDSGNTIIQKGANLYNNVTWSRNGQMDETSEEIASNVDGTKDGAVELSRNFAKLNGYTTVKSTLCYGVQWDATLTWIDPEYTGFAKNSTGMGWNSDNFENGNSIHQAGIDLNNGDNMQKKIYDLSGNAWEWTMESLSTSHRGRRGGDYYILGSEYPASSRSNNLPSNSSDSIGFRITLYL